MCLCLCSHTVWCTCDLLLPHVLSFVFTNKSRLLSNGFWRLDLQVESQDAGIQPTYLTYKQEFYPPYPLDVPYGASFHCSDATYCLEQNPITDKCNSNKTYPIVNIYGLQVSCVENEILCM